MKTAHTIECRFQRQRQRYATEENARLDTPLSAGRVPRLARLLALAIRFEELVRTGEVRDYATLARLGHVSRARISQITSLLLLAADIQEEILFLPAVEQGRDPIHLCQLQPLAAVLDWGEQRRLWRTLIERTEQSDRVVA
jgi:hypothetical protein